MISVYFREEVKDFPGQAVRSCSDDKPFDDRIRKDFEIFFPQLAHRRVGVGVVLKIGKILCLWPFCRKKGYLRVYGGSKFTGAGIGTERTTARAFRPVSVGAGKAAVNGEFMVF